MMHYNDLPLIDIKETLTNTVTGEVTTTEKTIGKEIDPKKLDTITFPIKFDFAAPILKGIASTEIREPTIGDVEEAQKEVSDLKQNKKLLTLIASNLSPEAVGEIVPRDFTKLLVLVTPFLG